jgi:hypothetical protein
MLAYATRVSHKLKEFIWTQIKLGYIVKQIYDKHKEIWWARANDGEYMTHDDFLQPRYRLLGPKTQEGHLALAHKPSAFHPIMGLCSS